MESELRFLHPSPLVSTRSATYRPPSFPPPSDWPVSVDMNGNSLSLYGDDYWNFNAFGFYGFEFGKHGLSDINRNLFKQAMLFVMYHPRIFPNKIESCQGYFYTLLKIAKTCEKFRISINDLNKYPEVFPSIVDGLQCARFQDRISQLHKLKLYSNELGFSIADDKLLAVMARKAKKYEAIQNPYIPPRIWNYQIERLNEAIDDFERHKIPIEKAFKWLHNAYQHNHRVSPEKYQSPFTEQHVYLKRTIYDGDFTKFLDDFGLVELFNRWLTSEESGEVRHTTLSFSKYLSLIRDISIIFILNFSMQRKGEASALRSDCFYVEHDPILGKICLIRGETTKTDSDSDARWVVPETIKKAVDSAAWIARLRLSSLPENFNLSRDIKDNPLLLTPACELWSSAGGQAKTEDGYRRLLNYKRTLDYKNIVRRGSRLFDESEILVTEEDSRFALAMTPNLSDKKWFGIGKPWNFGTHQARRTLAVNMFSSVEVSVGSIQHQMKHASRNMTLYYGRNYTNILLDSKVEKTLLIESYSSIYRKLVEVAENEVENVRPHKNSNTLSAVIELVDANEEKKLTQLIKKGQLGCRKTLLGFCMKAGACEYGGIESISKCAGGDGKGICSDAIFVRKNREKLLALKKSHQNELKSITANSMRKDALKQEIYAIKVYLNVVDKEKGRS